MTLNEKEKSVLYCSDLYGCFCDQSGHCIYVCLDLYWAYNYALKYTFVVRNVKIYWWLFGSKTWKGLLRDVFGYKGLEEENRVMCLYRMMN